MNEADSLTIAGRPVSQYGLLWEACMHSFPYLSQGLEDIRCGLDKPLDQEGWIPFFIPVIIKGLVGDALTYVGFPGTVVWLLTFSDLDKLPWLWIIQTSPWLNLT